MKQSNYADNLHRSWEDVPGSLTIDHLTDPIECIRQFTDAGSLTDIRERFEDMYMAALYSPHWRHDNPEMKGDSFTFYTNIRELIELAFVIDKMLADGQLVYSYLYDADTNKE